ncbi:preprotein translocase subunit SecY [Mycoplasmopsis columboralis]|uniref:Protein translocase subunit SecY n=1 Tax=Mycoplasmopsis columboralis TaxID=171282 RepID=A0A449B6M7_9BACT|nr:preprotein translocase subunit SecY [Mycoplasmopsis columboralis]VEU76212.1 preprotein translocase subunit SecY [Mycoplasmopsis columboralis]
MRNLTFTFSRLLYKARNNWKEFWSSKEIIRKVIYTFLLLAVFVIGTTITVPFVKLANNSSLGNSSNSFVDTLNLVGGGGLRQFSLFALGISPFINASLIMMILQTPIFPPIYKLSQSGPHGRKKINIITRIITLVIAYPQAVFLMKSLAAGQNPFIEIVNTNAFSSVALEYFIVPMILTAASLFALFISEQITNKGIGNGTSLIIFTGIAIRLPYQFQSAFKYFIGDISNSNGTLVGIISFLTYVLIYFIFIVILAIVYNAERLVPIQQIGAGRSKSLKEMGKLPIKLNPGGIMPIIFAMMVLSFPSMIANLLPNTSASKQFINTELQFTRPIGLSLLVGITFVFSIILGLQQSRADKIAEDFAKNSTFIPGVRPGEETQDYLIAIVFRLSLFSAFYLVILASMQFIQILLGLPAAISFGGTSLMILVSVALETVAQLTARLKSSRLAKAKRQSRQYLIDREKYDIDNRGLLW